MLDTSGTDYAAAPVGRGTAISNRLTVGTQWTQASPELAPGEDFDRFGTRRRPTASADRPPGGRPRLPPRPADEAAGLTPAATRGAPPRPRPGPWGHPAVSDSPPQPPPPDVSPATGQHLHARAAAERHRGLVHRRAARPTWPREHRSVPTWRLGSPCVSIYVPAFPRTVAGPPPFVPFELSSEPMWRAADALRQRVDAEPEAIGADQGGPGPGRRGAVGRGR